MCGRAECGAVWSVNRELPRNLTTVSRCTRLFVVAWHCRNPGGGDVDARLLLWMSSLSLVTFTDPYMPPPSLSQSIRIDRDCNDKLAGRKVTVSYNGVLPRAVLVHSLHVYWSSMATRHVFISASVTQILSIFCARILLLSPSRSLLDMTLFLREEL